MYFSKVESQFYARWWNGNAANRTAVTKQRKYNFKLALSY